MDSPDKTVNTGTFKYDWVSSIDDDGTWALVAANANIVRVFSGHHVEHI